MSNIREILPRDKAIEQIEWYIMSNELKPHTKLPSERSMCEMWGINRSTLRVALKRLIDENVIYSEKGSGTYVAPPRLIRNLQDAKSTSESMRGTGYFLWTEVLEARIEESDKHVSLKLGIPEHSKVFYLKRRRIRKNVPFMIERSYINYQYCKGIEEKDLSDQSVYRILEEYGINLVRGKESISITYASENEASILNVEEGQFLYLLTGIAEDDKGRAIEYFENVARSDEIQFTSTLRRQHEDEGRE